MRSEQTKRNMHLREATHSLYNRKRGFAKRRAAAKRAKIARRVNRDH